MPLPVYLRGDTRADEAAGSPGQPSTGLPVMVSIGDLRPRTPAEFYDAAGTLMRQNPALLFTLGSLHVLPVACVVSALAMWAERGLDDGFDVLWSALLMVLAVGAVALRPFSLAATALAVRVLCTTREPSASLFRECLGRAWSRRWPLLDVAAAALLVDLLTLGLLRIGGARHVLVPLVVLEDLSPASARREAARLAQAHIRARLLVNAHGLALLLVVFFNLWAGALGAVAAGQLLFGLDLAVARGFIAPGNPPFALLLLAVTVLLLEPLRAVVKSLYLLDIRLREGGSDLMMRIARLPRC